MPYIEDRGAWFKGQGYWQHIPDGLAEHDFPKAYVDSVLATYEAAAPCPRADRPNPSAVPGKSAATR